MNHGWGLERVAGCVRVGEVFLGRWPGHALRALAGALLAVLLAACGGGGGGAPPSDPVGSDGGGTTDGLGLSAGEVGIYLTVQTDSGNYSDCTLAPFGYACEDVNWSSGVSLLMRPVTGQLQLISEYDADVWYVEDGHFFRGGGRIHDPRTLAPGWSGDAYSGDHFYVLRNTYKVIDLGGYDESHYALESWSLDWATKNTILADVTGAAVPDMRLFRTGGGDLYKGRIARTLIGGRLVSALRIEHFKASAANGLESQGDVNVIDVGPYTPQSLEQEVHLRWDVDGGYVWVVHIDAEINIHRAPIGGAATHLASIARPTGSEFGTLDLGGTFDVNKNQILVKFASGGLVYYNADTDTATAYSTGDLPIQSFSIWKE